MAKVLIVEDDEKLALLVRDLLIMENHHVESSSTGGDALNRLLTCQYDLILLDWDLPEVTGLEILKEVRNRGCSTPILMLTGKSHIDNKEAGLGAGADDYLTKPFEGRELIARLKALLRRAGTRTEDTLKFAGLSLDRAQYQALRDGQEIALVPKEFDLLEFFMRNPNRVFSPESLLTKVWADESEATAAAVTTCIKRLRKKIDTDEKKSFIATVHGVGYKLVDPAKAKA